MGFGDNLEGGEEGAEKPFAKFSDSCFLMDYIDVIAKKGVEVNTSGFRNFKVIDASPERSLDAPVVSRVYI